MVDTASKMIGVLSAENSLSGMLSDKQSLSGSLSMPTEYIADSYDGPYTITPKANDVTIINTKGKLMESNVTVTKIPFFSTDNESSGTTIYIADSV